MRLPAQNFFRRKIIFENITDAQYKAYAEYLEKKDASKRNELSVLGMLKWTFDKSYIGHWETIILTFEAFV